jgi:gliding motility-associated lipoprotein GldH
MRVAVVCWILLCVVMASCDDARVYEKYSDLDDNLWKVSEKPEFEFSIDNPAEKFNLYSNVRNTVSYPWSRFFMTYYLKDSTGTVLKQKLTGEFLFEEQSGAPFGKSGMGDIYDHQFLLLKDFQFPYKGKYKVQFEHFMRTDSLEGIVAVGLRVERSELK